MGIERYRGCMVSIEGINGAGKSTQTSKLAAHLRVQNEAVATFKSPALDTTLGPVIASALDRQVDIHPAVLMALFAANRLECGPEIKRHLAEGKVVLCDRYSESEYAYGLALDLPLPWLINLELLAPAADLVILLDLPATVAHARLKATASGDRFETDVQFLSRVREHYLQFALRPPKPNQIWQVINAQNRLGRVTSEVQLVVDRWLANFRGVSRVG